MTVAVVTPWWNHRELFADYQDAIVAGEPDEVIVVDNGSDPALDFAAVRCDVNQGFARGCNAGLLEAAADVVVFLNNDIRMVDRQWLVRLLAAVEPGVLAGPNLRTDRHADVDGQSFPYLDGWCIAGMRGELLDLGGFDEDLVEPSYYSDNILCLRARLAGMSLREVQVGLVHKVSQTSGGGANPLVAKAVEENFARYEELAREALEPA